MYMQLYRWYSEAMLIENDLKREVNISNFRYIHFDIEKRYEILLICSKH